MPVAREQAARLNTPQKVDPTLGKLAPQRVLTGTAGSLITKMDTETPEQKDKRKVNRMACL